MKAIELCGYEGVESLRVVDVKKPEPSEKEILIQVKAAGINFAELELTHGRYRVPKSTPFIMGFEAAGIVHTTGAGVSRFKPGDRVTSIVSSGGYAEYAIADEAMAIAVPDGISFAEAATIPIQGLSAYALLKYAARPQPQETVLIQAAAGGVGLYLVQLTKLMGAGRVIALAGTKQKLDLVAGLGADVAINYTDPNWPVHVKHLTDGKGVDVVLEAASGVVGEESFKLLAPFGRVVIFGARNVHDTFSPDKVQQLIYNNQTVIGFNFPTFQPGRIAACVPELLSLITGGRIKLFANHSFPLADVSRAYRVFSDRQTIGKVVLIP